jgi:hypothetical protein
MAAEYLLLHRGFKQFACVGFGQMYYWSRERAKSQHGLDRARLCGLVKMHIQGLLTAMVLNVKKLLQAISGRKAAFCHIGYCVMRDVFKFILWCSFCLRRGSF